MIPYTPPVAGVPWLAGFSCFSLPVGEEPQREVIMLPAVGWGQPPELPDSDVTALICNIFATLTGSYPYDPVSESKVRRDLMEKQTGFLGISSAAWVVIGILALMGGGAIVIWALLALAFGVSIG